MIGPAILQARQAAGLTQTAAAGKAGCSQAEWSSWERGDREPSLANLSRIAAALGVTPPDLVRAALEPGKGPPRRSS